MRRLIVLLAGFVAACAIPGGAPVLTVTGYAPPASAASPIEITGQRTVPGATAIERLEAFAAARDEVSSRPTALNRSIDVRYAGGAADFIDCGTLRTDQGDFPATSRYRVADPGAIFAMFDRTLTLDIRTVANLREPNQVALSSTYVVTRRVAHDRLAGAGEVDGDVAVANAAGALDLGSVACVVTGAWERLLLDAIDGSPRSGAGG